MKTGELAMDVGTVLNGTDAVKEGLIDSLGGLSDALHYLYTMIDETLSDQEEKSDVVHNH